MIRIRRLSIKANPERDSNSIRISSGTKPQANSIIKHRCTVCDHVLPINTIKRKVPCTHCGTLNNIA